MNHRHYLKFAVTVQGNLKMMNCSYCSYCAHFFQWKLLW